MCVKLLNRFQAPHRQMNKQKKWYIHEKELVIQDFYYCFIYLLYSCESHLQGKARAFCCTYRHTQLKDMRWFIQSKLLYVREDI